MEGEEGVAGELLRAKGNSWFHLAKAFPKLMNNVETETEIEMTLIEIARDN